MLGLGCNNFGLKLDREASAAVVAAALDVGITHFDTADVYGDGASEEFLGAALHGVRDEVVIATKAGIRRDRTDGGGSRDYLMGACERSLRRLGTDRIDVFYVHKPDLTTPRDETVAALMELHKQGKVLHVACSNHSASDLANLWHLTGGGDAPPFAAVQLPLSLVDRASQKELLPTCKDLGLGAVVFTALANGLLTGKYSRAASFPAGSRLAEIPTFADIATPGNLEAAELVRDLAADRGVRSTALALSWVARQPGVASVLTGATRPEQVQHNAEDIAHILDPLDEVYLDHLFDNSREVQ